MGNRGWKNTAGSSRLPNMYTRLLLRAALNVLVALEVVVYACNSLVSQSSVPNHVVACVGGKRWKIRFYQKKNR